jgi:hypothetical protein
MKESLKDRQERQAIEGVQTMADYRAAEKATYAKTGRLKVERRAREGVVPAVMWLESRAAQSPNN